MSQHHKLVYGSLFVFFAATHAGCAGSGLKNMFTRNETDGYHSLDELETDKQSVAETEASGDEVRKPSMANRLASWRPFSKSEPTGDDPSVASDADTSDGDSEDAGSSPRFLSRAFMKQESVEPDPFLSEKPGLADGAKSHSLDAVSHKKIATIDDESKKVENEYAFEGGPKPKSAKDAITGSRKGQHRSESTDVETHAVALGASRKSDSTASDSDDEDRALSKRFEQHFLLNSIGIVEKTESEVAEFGNDMRQKVSTRADSTSEKSGNALAAFDQLMGTDGSVTSHDETEVKNTVGRRPKKKAEALDVNVADAEALFGAAAARQNARLPQSGTSNRTDSSDRHADRSSVWSLAAENSEQFEGEDSRQGKTGSQPDGNGGDIASAFARHLSGNSGNRRVRNHNAAFGAPPASAGSVEGDVFPAEETPDVRLSNASAFSNEHKIVTANYGTARPNVVRHSAATETSTAGDTQLTGDAQFTAAPVAPVSQQESVSEPDSAATRRGLVQSFSTRNWLLLIGGVIVIALLFAPGRTKPLTVNGRPSNG